MKISDDYHAKLRLWAAALVLFPTAGCSLISVAHAEPRKPNVILLCTDDHGYADLGVQGFVSDVKTPHLDALARDGVRFQHGYVSAPQCVPSRAGLMTGRYQQRFGVEDNVTGPLPLVERTLAERLKEAGYATGQIGKWHLDHEQKPAGGPRRVVTSPEFMPHAHGFDEYWRGEMRQYYASHDLQGKAFADAPRLVPDTRFRVDVQTEAALAFLDRRLKRPDQPFFLYLAWMAPHVPLEAPEKYLARFPGVQDPKRRTALAMISAIDDGVGQIRARLREHGLEKETLLFFISDNGAPVTDRVWDGSLNTPLIGEKGMLTEGGIRVPFLAAWPGMLPAGQVYEAPVISLDVAATAVALAGLPHDPVLDGVNLLPFLTGKKSGNPHEQLFWRWRSQAAVRAGRWKLILLGPERRYLFDLESPEGETKDRLAEFPQVAAELELKLKPWAATLTPAGLPASLNAAEAEFFAAHMDKTVAAGPRRQKGETAETIQGWVGRNCRLSVRGQALLVEPAAAGPDAVHFIAQAKLEVAAPLEVRLRLRSGQAGKGGVQWRLPSQDDFPADQRAGFDISASGNWEDVRVAIPAEGRIVHLRLLLPRGQSVEFEKIQLFSGARGTSTSAEPVREWSFSVAK